MASTKDAITWAIVCVAWNVKYYLIERVAKLENDRDASACREEKQSPGNYRDGAAGVQNVR